MSSHSTIEIEFPKNENLLLNNFNSDYAHDLKNTPAIYKEYRDFYEKCLNDVAMELKEIIKKPNALIEIKRMIETWESV